MGRIARSRRPGLTIVELLVVIAIIGVLVALLVPAVQMAREAARASQCKSNMRQLVVGCDAFYDAHNHYPTSQIFDRHGWGPDSTAWSWLARILPFAEQKPLFDMGDIPFRTLRESKIADQTIPLFLCPDDSPRNRTPRLDAGNLRGFPVGQTNYKGVMGANWGADESQKLGPGKIGTLWVNKGTNGSYDGLNNGDGLLYRTDYLKPRNKSDVRDGLSNTFMIGEDLPVQDEWCAWPYATNAYSTCAIPPNQKWSDPGWWPNTQSFRSWHPKGLYFTMADGSVRFVSDSIELSVYRALATIDGGETVDVPE